MSWSLSVSSVKRDEIKAKLDDAIENQPDTFLSNPEGKATAQELAPTAVALLEKIVDRGGTLVGVTMSGHTDPDGATSIYIGAWLSG